MLDFLRSLTAFEWTALVISLALLVAASPLLKAISGQAEDPSLGMRIAVLRGLNVLFIGTLLVSHVADASGDTTWDTRILGVLLVLYAGYLAHNVFVFLIRRRFGRERTVDGETFLADTYNSRALALLSAVLVTVSVIISGVQVLEFDSLLEKGILGFVGVLLALTQGSWAPDIIAGLIILNSRFIREGDVVEVDEGPQRFVGFVFRIKMFHTEFLDVANNHRIMIRNSRLQNFDLHNLNRFASAKGLREQLLFKIDYAVAPTDARAMFEAAVSEASCYDDIAFERQFPAEVSVMDTGDYAVTWALHYYIKDVRLMLRTRQQMYERVLESATARDISLATPVLLTNG